MARAVLPPEKHTEIVRLCAEGLKKTDIARRVGCDESTVRRHLKKDPDVPKLAEQKKEEIRMEVFDVLESLKPSANFILTEWAEILKAALPRLREALSSDDWATYFRYLTQVSTAVGVYIDKMTMTEAKQPGMRKDNNLFDAIDRSVEGAIDYSDIPEIQPSPETGDDLVGAPGTEQI